MRFRVSLIVASALAMGLLSLPAHPQVTNLVEGGLYAALVEDNEGGYRAFSSANQESGDLAKQDALRQCGKASCEVVLVFRGQGCGSFHSAGPEAAFGWAVKPTLSEARAESLAQCRSEISGSEVCSNTISDCNTRGGGTARSVYSLSDIEDDEDDYW